MSSDALPPAPMEGRPVRIQLAGQAEDPPRGPGRWSWRAGVAVLALFAVTLLAAHSCQQAQVRLDKDQAIRTALPLAGFTPQRTQVRLVRQGLGGRPYWAVSFSVPAASGEGFAHLTTVRVDANTGAVGAVNRDRP